MFCKFTSNQFRIPITILIVFQSGEYFVAAVEKVVPNTTSNSSKKRKRKDSDSSDVPLIKKKVCSTNFLTTIQTNLKKPATLYFIILSHRNHRSQTRTKRNQIFNFI